jgi:hypothetical protein
MASPNVGCSGLEEARENDFKKETMSMLNRERIHQTVAFRNTRRAQRRDEVKAMYPHARTLLLRNADPVGPVTLSDAEQANLPRTITLVTPDHSDPSKDHFYIGAHPVLLRHHKWDADHEEVTFVASDGTSAIKGNLRMMRSRTQAFGVLEWGGHTFSVEYGIKPQRYRLKRAKDAAYTSPAGIVWDETLERWKNATWSGFELDLTYGLTEDESVGEATYTVTATFRNEVTGEKWSPDAGTYTALLNSDQILTFDGTPMDPAGGGRSTFPSKLRVQLSAFADQMVGGMVDGGSTGSPVCYGLQGDVVSSSNAAGLYQLAPNDGGVPGLIAVHDGKMYVGETSVPNAIVVGNLLSWDNVSPDLAAAAGLPVRGHVEFSDCGNRVVSSSLGLSGERIHPDQAADIATHLPDAHPTRKALLHAQAMSTLGAPTPTDLINMSQFVKNEKGLWYDQVQQDSMKDFYDVLQHYMTDADCKQFFNANPQPLPDGVAGIAALASDSGTPAEKYYRDLSIAYTVGTLSRWNADQASKYLNGKRAYAWISRQGAISDVMKKQAPLLYARRYGESRPIDWFLNDQIKNADTYARRIDAQVKQWREEASANEVADAATLKALLDQIQKLGDHAKEKKQYWAFWLYVYCSKPAYLNMLRSLVLGGAEIDGSEASRRIQRTVALLGVLDTTSFFSGEYAYMLQLFQVGSMLPQLADYGNIKDFNFAVKRILDQFVKQYIDSPDPKMKEVALQIREHSSRATIELILECFRAASATSAGMYSWTTACARFQSTVAKLGGKIPPVVANLVLGTAAALVITFLATGKIPAEDVTPAEWAAVGFMGTAILARIALFVVREGMEIAQVIGPKGVWGTLKLLMTRELAAESAVQQLTGFRGWMLGTSAFQRELEGATFISTFEFALEEEQAAAACTLNMTKIFGKNLDEFIATRLGAVAAMFGIIMAAVGLAEGGVPMEIAANSLFLATSTLELFATAGAWATGALEITTVGGFSVASILCVVNIVALAALVAGFILICVLLFKPQPSPVETFARNRAGKYFMPFRTDIDYFESFQPAGEEQRAGIAIFTTAAEPLSLHIGADGSLSQKQFDQKGNCWFYLRVDDEGRAQFGAPIVGADGTFSFWVLGVDDAGKLTAVKGDNSSSSDARMQWIAEIQGEGQYKKASTVDGAQTDFLDSAPFKLYSVSFHAKGEKRYLSADGTSGWQLVRDSGSVVQLKMVTTQMDGLKMTDVNWYTNQHDMKQSPSLSIPGSASREWSLDPALPQGLAFDKGTGVISMIRGADVPAAPQKSYTITVTSKAGGSVTTTFKLAVLAASA